MENKLLTQKDLAERWQVTEESIRNWRNEGIIQTAKGVPVIRFTMQHILELEGVKLEKFSPLLKRKMERELEELREENQRLKKIIGNVLAETSQVIGI
ncbi:MAG: helix-turn-helix domain-containing protein [Clostridiales bacterium]|nr:helix-turn-helix domain-containing protein [Clostridiales bacterium]